MEAETRPKVVLLFLLVVLGVLAHWFWNLGWEFLRNPDEGITWGPPAVILVRVALSFIAAALTFVPIYNKIGQPTEQSWVAYFLAFQNGFFWEAAMEAIVKGL
jgi:hypothetical protein